jgi:hypothetical protein
VPIRKSTLGDLSDERGHPFCYQVRNGDVAFVAKVGADVGLGVVQEVLVDVDEEPIVIHVAF